MSSSTATPALPQPDVLQEPMGQQQPPENTHERMSDDYTEETAVLYWAPVIIIAVACGFGLVYCFLYGLM